jgi:hypothetical protein
VARVLANARHCIQSISIPADDRFESALVPNATDQLSTYSRPKSNPMSWIA